jgi:outer membrane receptor for ferrienterochelin and colicins
MKSIPLVVFILLMGLSKESWCQQLMQVRGYVKDESGNPLSNATVNISSLNKTTLSGPDGLFLFKNINEGDYLLTFSCIGYADSSLNFLGGVNNTEINIRLRQKFRVGESIVITSSRHKENIVDAAMQIGVLQETDFNKSASYNPAEMFSQLQGVEFVRSGVNVITVNARGFNNANNAKVLQLTDGRNSMLAGANGLPAGMMNTVIKEDIKQIEMALGPNAAIYGPNAHNGVLNTITKDPRQYQGTTVVLAGGSYGLFSSRIRHAQKYNERWAYKITGEYTTGNDFTFKDSVFAGGGNYGPAVTIQERIKTFQFRHIRGEAHILYSLKENEQIEMVYGASTNDYINVGNLTRNQGDGWKFSFVQLRYASPHLQAQLYQTYTNAGDTYGIAAYTRDYWNRTHSTITNPNDALYTTQGYLSPDSAELFATRLGNRFREKSKRVNADLQYEKYFTRLMVKIMAVASVQADRPKTYGTILIDSKEPVKINQYGIGLQVEKRMPFKLKLTIAGRFDNHNLFGNLFSPKLALVKHIRNGAIRLTWGKAYAAPIILFQRASVFGLIFGNGNGVNYIPNGAKVTDQTSRATTTPIRPEEIQTFETGFKGRINSKLSVDLNVYYSRSQNFLSPAISVGGRVLSIGNSRIDPAGLLIPGTVDNAGILSAASFSTYFNYGKVAAYGTDIGLTYFISKKVYAGVKYSWFGSDITKNNNRNDANRDGYVAEDERSLNAPHNKLTAIVNIDQILKKRMFINLAVRIVQAYDLYSGNQIATRQGEGSRGIVYGGINPLNMQPRYYLKNFNWGGLGGFTSVDISTGYKLNEKMQVNAGINNLFDVTQREFVASPSIGRLFNIELKMNIQ